MTHTPIPPADGTQESPFAHSLVAWHASPFCEARPLELFEHPSTPQSPTAIAPRSATIGGAILV
jgi:hypothetical protein